MLLKLTRRALAALAASAFLAACAPATPAAAEPAMWVIKDQNSTIYLFGTMHSLKPDTQWRSPSFDKAFAESSDLVLEAADAVDPVSLQPFIRTEGRDPVTPLDKKLSPADWARLTIAAKDLGLTPQALQPMRPWLVALLLSNAPMTKAGYDSESGVEIVLTKEAKATGKPISSLESVEQQVRVFASLTPEAELAFLISVLDMYDEAGAKVDQIAAAWKAGDVKKLEAITLDPAVMTPALYDALLMRRNRSWTDQLEKKLAGTGVSFVAVGQGHLLGPDSVQEMLKKRGISVERR